MNATTDGSNSQGELEEAVIEEVFQYFAVNYVNLAAFVLVLFDYLITLDCEVRFAWSRNCPWARVVLVLNRYLALLYFFLSLTPLLPTESTLSCTALNYTLQTTLVILYVVWAAFSGLRIYAISATNRLVTFVVVLLALVPAAVNLYSESATYFQYTSEDGCMLISSITPSMFHYLTIATRASLSVSEAIVVAVTWMKTCSIVHSGASKQPLSSGRSAMTFTSLVLREGIVYFCVVLSLNIVQLVFTFLESSTLSLVLQILDVLTPILISRFYFDLGALNRREATDALPSVRSTTTLRFARSDAFHQTANEDEDEDGDGDEDGSFSDIVFSHDADSSRAAGSPWPAKELEVVYA